ncbi:daunorubicin ABC transporter ATP-binding protein [Thermococcus eurythermalis]|uniref:Daunorubicin ABC transporter ATP-binding protein n=1 Tax=Thermococcus eurythermalis TaxID=1505907 RepID=A0A097QUY9_9EURY|nr:ABC transporter ATP-binding protein [Thermococcus eurythermalis]AIU70295.1 daunorubicin ABC transporter ATP-binding protein [Thermococcus eurythermalis]
MNVIEVKDLTKTYGAIKALDAITFSIPDGVILGVIGPNGAGKTTLIRILSCLLSYDSGTVRLFGMEVKRCGNKIKRKIAILPQEVRAHFYTLTPFEYVYHYLRMRGLSRNEAKNRANRAMEKFGIEYHNRIMSTLSGGMVRKTLLAMVLSANAELYFLDEPTVGLDVESRLKLWEVLRERAEDSTIILTSHYLNEISTVSDLVLLLKNKVLAFGPPEEIAKRYLSDFVSKLVVFGDFGGEFISKKAGRNTILYFRSKAEEREAITLLEELGIPFRREELTIEDVFLVGELE